MKVSIIMPTYNGAKYLQQSLESCLNQTWSELEVIVVIDGSSDDTRQILSCFNDKRLHIVEHLSNRGLAEALNTGMEVSTGKLLTWTSDDNLYLPHAIEKMTCTLTARQDVDFVYSSYYLIDENGWISAIIPALEPNHLWENDVVGPCFLFRREVWEQTGRYNPALRNIEDYEYWLRVSQKFQMLADPEVLYKYRQHSLSLTGRLNVFERARQSAYMKRSLGGISQSQLRREIARINMAEAFECFASGNREPIPQLILASLRRNPHYAANRGVWSILVRSLLS